MYKVLVGKKGDSVNSILLELFSGLENWSLSGNEVINNNYDMRIKFSDTSIISGNSTKYSENSNIAAGFKIDDRIHTAVSNNKATPVFVVAESATFLSIFISIKAYNFKDNDGPTSEYKKTYSFTVSLVDNTTVSSNADVFVWITDTPLTGSYYGLLFNDTWYQDTQSSSSSIDSEQCIIGDLIPITQTNSPQDGSLQYCASPSIHINLDNTTDNGQLSLIGFIKNCKAEQYFSLINGVTTYKEDGKYYISRTAGNISTNSFLFLMD